jgi:hypothetical protein
MTMKISIPTIVASAVLACMMMAGTAQAQTQDRFVSNDVPADVLYKQIVAAATDICREAIASGETLNLRRCTAVVVAKTVAEANLPSLTTYANTIPLARHA